MSHKDHSGTTGEFGPIILLCIIVTARPKLSQLLLFYQLLFLQILVLSLYPCSFFSLPSLLRSGNIIGVALRCQFLRLSLLVRHNQEAVCTALPYFLFKAGLS